MIKDQLLAQAKKALYDASCIMSGVIIKNDYQQKAYQDVLNAWHAIDKHAASQDVTEEIIDLPKKPIEF